MATKASDLTTLKSVLLEGSPSGQEKFLADTLQKLVDLIAAGELESAEELVQILGTAVGKQSSYSL